MTSAPTTLPLPPLSNGLRLTWDNFVPLRHAHPQETHVIWPSQLSQNQLFWSSSKRLLEHLVTSQAPTFTLAYMDPPFASKANYIRRLRFYVRDRWVKLPIQEYSDHWNDSDYLQFIYEHLTLIHALLAPNGSIVVHCDWHQNHHIRLLLDQVFGRSQFQNELIFAYGAGGQPKHKFPRKHDTLLWYCKGQTPKFNSSVPEVRVPYDPSTLKSHYTNKDNDGRLYRRQRKNGQDYITYADQGKLVTSVWGDLKAQLATSPISQESTGYPTQKPEALLKRVIGALSDEGDWILDPFMGSGTTISVAEKLNRQWIGGDSNFRAIETTRQRLGQCDHSLQSIQPTSQPQISAEVRTLADQLVIDHLTLRSFEKYFNDPNCDLWPNDWPHLIQCIDIQIISDRHESQMIQVRAEPKRPVQTQYHLPKWQRLRLRITDYLGGCFDAEYRSQR